MTKEDIPVFLQEYHKLKYGNQCFSSLMIWTFFSSIILERLLVRMMPDSSLYKHIQQSGNIWNVYVIAIMFSVYLHIGFIAEYCIS